MTGSGSRAAVAAYGRDASHYDDRTARYGRYRRRVVDLLPLSPGTPCSTSAAAPACVSSGWSTASGPPAG